MLVFVMPTSYPNPDNIVANSFVMEQVKALSKHNDIKIVVLNVQKQTTSKSIKKVDNKIYVVNDGNSDIVRKKSRTFIEKKLPRLNDHIFAQSMNTLFNYAVEQYGYPDIIYAHFYHAGLAAIDISSGRFPVVVMEHSGDLMNKNIGAYEKRALKKVIDECYCYIATTNRLKEKAQYHSGSTKEIAVIPNVVDDMFSYEPLINDEFSFLAVSRVEYDKRIDLLIDSFCKAFDPNDKVELRIGGDGSLLNELQKMVKSYKRDNQIHFLGKLSREDVALEMKKCSCFVLPSRHETFGLVWREALCVGRPVITTDHGGFSDCDWDDKFGKMIPVDDEDALVSALQYIYNNYGEYDLKNISMINKRFYGADIVGDRIYDIFQTALKEAHR